MARISIKLEQAPPEVRAPLCIFFLHRREVWYHPISISQSLTCDFEFHPPVSFRVCHSKSPDTLLQEHI